jgi:N-acetylmuramic acid 6-phosphate etherase
LTPLAPKIGLPFKMNSSTYNLGIEGGGTRTTWAIVTNDGQIKAQGEAGPGNTLLLSDAALFNLFQTIQRHVEVHIDSIGGAFAGSHEHIEQARVQTILRQVWPRAKIVCVGEDVISVLYAAFGKSPGVIVIAGTGANVAGRISIQEPVVKAGGWGHIFADRGSAYDLARRGLEIAYDRYDETGSISLLGHEYLVATGAGNMEEMAAQILRNSSKKSMAMMARCVFDAAKKGDLHAHEVLNSATAALAKKTSMVITRLHLSTPQIALVGGLFNNQPEYINRFSDEVKRLFPNAKLFLLTVPGAVGSALWAASLACEAQESTPSQITKLMDKEETASGSLPETLSRNEKQTVLARA